MDSGLLYTIYCLADFPCAAIAAVCGALCFNRARKQKGDQTFFLLLCGFFFCIFLCDVFFILSWLVIDFPFVISPGDLSWAGSLVFLITADMGLMDSWTDEQKQAAKKYKPPALFAPAVCIGSCAVFIAIYPEIVANYILYCVPTTILSYYALMMWLAGKKCGVQIKLRNFHLVILVWIALQLFHDLFTTLGFDYGYAVPSTIFIWLIIVPIPMIYLAAKEGVSA